MAKKQRPNAIFKSVRLVIGAIKPRPYLRPALNEVGKVVLEKQIAKAMKGATKDNLFQKLDSAVRIAALATQTQAVRLCPFDTGRLSSSINMQRRRPLYYTIGTNVEYAATMEFGRKRKETNRRIFPRVKKALAFVWDKLPPRGKGQRRKSGRVG